MSDRATDRQKSTIKSLLEQAEYDHLKPGTQKQNRQEAAPSGSRSARRPASGT